MAIKTTQYEKDTIYFCTFTCYNKLPLFEKTDFYEEIYKWFNYLHDRLIEICAFVIMPNHIHIMLFVPENAPTLNKIIGNGKRFMAYEIIKKLKEKNDIGTLAVLQEAVSEEEKNRGKRHRVFTPSFDAKPCYSEKFIGQKLKYIHHNPVSGKWYLTDDFTQYEHSSARFYELNQNNYYFPLKHYEEVGSLTDISPYSL